MKKKIHLARWEILCLLLDKVGGLGMRLVEDFNVALMLKWGWRIFQAGDSLWNEILAARYGNLHLKLLTENVGSVEGENRRG